MSNVVGVVAAAKNFAAMPDSVKAMKLNIMHAQQGPFTIFAHAATMKGAKLQSRDNATNGIAHLLGAVIKTKQA